uniref:Little elongation complex subunit 2 C-terminal domain-containing protein n=1 Tax=Lygus hesperus TaxID=30085 RepID=A0A0K8SA19_LYGHE
MTTNSPSSPTINPPWMEELDQQIDDLVNAAPFILPKPFEDVCEYIENRSLTFKMFRNEFLQTKNKKSKNKQERLTRELLQPDWWAPPRQRLYYVFLPFNRSLFTAKEMNDLYAVYTAGPNTSPPSSSQIMTYTNSLANIKTENDEYLQHIKRRWLEESWSRVNVIKEEVTQFVPTWWKNRLNRIERCAETYSRMSPVPLTPSETEGKLVFLKNLKELGSLTRYYSSAHHKSGAVSMSIVQEELLEREGDRFKRMESTVNDTDKEVGDDKMAECFAVDHQAEIVTTPSVLKTILANSPGTFEETWCIPFKIKEVSSGDHNRKVIFMDKKLPPKTLTISEKNALYSKIAARAIFRKSKKSLSSMVPNTADQVDKDGEENYQLPSIEKKRLEKEVQYNLWEYRAVDEHSVLSKNHRKPFKILLRTKTEGKNFDAQRQLSPCVMSTKLDFQPEFGASQMNFRELMGEWISLKLRPNSFLHRVRVDPMKGGIIMVESKTPAAIANDSQRLHSRCVEHQLSLIQILFDHISPLPPGNYLLNHDIKDKGFMYIYHELLDKQKRSATNLNIRELYNRVDVDGHAEQVAPWIPIDPNIMTPTLHSLKRIPCVFPPAKDDANRKRVQIPAKKKIKKNRKKNKGKNPMKGSPGKPAQGKNKETNRPIPENNSRSKVSYDEVLFD